MGSTQDRAPGEMISGRGEENPSWKNFGGDAHIMKMRGLKYAEDDLWLRYGSTRGVSNLAAGDVSFSVEKGHVLVVINEEVV